MTREQLLSKLCCICASVYDHKKDFSKSFDCFCLKGLARGASWENESIIEFIKEAVEEKIEVENAKKVKEKDKYKDSVSAIEVAKYEAQESLLK
jgi:hypothetical protein